MSAARHPYPSKLTDAEWAVLEPLLPAPVGRGRPPKWPRRQVADAIFYLGAVIDSQTVKCTGVGGPERG